MTSQWLCQNVQLADWHESSLVAHDVLLNPEIVEGNTFSKGSDQTTDVQAQSVQADPSLCTGYTVGFAMHRPMRDLFVQTLTPNTLDKISSGRYFEIFFSFFQENRICISCKLSPLHECQTCFLGNKKK